jgi:hypothetical protein
LALQCIFCAFSSLIGKSYSSSPEIPAGAQRDSVPQQGGRPAREWDPPGHVPQRHRPIGQTGSLAPGFLPSSTLPRLRSTSKAMGSGSPPTTRLSERGPLTSSPPAAERGKPTRSAPTKLGASARCAVPLGHTHLRGWPGSLEASVIAGHSIFSYSPPLSYLVHKIPICYHVVQYYGPL